MFERRLKWFCVILGVAALVILARLVELQVVRADEYRAMATRVTKRPVRYLRAVRGSILDRTGRVLVRDEPAFDISINFGVLAGREEYLASLARQLRRANGPWKGQPLDEVLAELYVRVQRTWERLSELSNAPLTELLGRADGIRARVERIGEAHRRRRAIPEAERAKFPIREEFEFHPLIEDVPHELAMAVRTELEELPWVRVTPGSRRVAIDADHLAHLLGRVRSASPEAIDDDPLSDDESRSLRAGELCGTSGVERLGETVLRGTRGRVVEDFDRSILEWSDQKPGSDLRLTIDGELQRGVMRILAEGVAASQHPAGASAVVLDARTREILVLASYPAYHVDDFSRDYDVLRRDNRTSPLLFRAVAAQYPPGSICKVASLLGGLTDGTVNVNTTVECRGYMDAPNAFRCWIYNQYGMAHGAQTPEEAVRNSCNIFFYTLGERMGAERLCTWFRRVGLGRHTGSGLMEEVSGIVPDSAWLLRMQGRTHQRADARNYAIGQGEVTVTPLQAANATASVAMGRWAAARLMLGREAGDAAADMDTSPYGGEALRIIRRGMWRVVNDNEGTGKHAKLEWPGYELCGKTGSAQTVPTVIRSEYELAWADGRREKVVAGSREDAIERFPGMAPPRVVGWKAVERYPDLLPGERLPAHGWFVGYTQSSETRRGDAPKGRAYALAVIIEFAGSGGQIAGPVAKRIAELVLSQDEGRS